MDELENKMDSISNNMENKLDKIADKSENTNMVVHNLNEMMAKMWGSKPDRTLTFQDQENKNPMEYDLTRDEQ
jgi:DNA topoisomerase IA